MKRMALFAAIIAAVSLGVVVGVGGVAGAYDSTGHAAGGHAHGVLGTWLVDVQPAGDAPFQAMLTFSPGGGLIETESANPGTLQGSWVDHGGGRLAFTLQGFQFDQEGQPAGHVVVRGELNPVGGGRLSGPFTVEVFDPAGNIVFTGTGSATARPFEVQPL